MGFPFKGKFFKSTISSSGRDLWSGFGTGKMYEQNILHPPQWNQEKLHHCLYREWKTTT
jgi:hypothetical protein